MRKFLLTIIGLSLVGPCPAFAKPQARFVICAHNETGAISVRNRCTKNETRVNGNILGSHGIIGPTGPDGEPGAPGIQGVQGSTGPQGAPGLQGLVGAVGATGVAGITGAPGPTGAAGAPGSDAGGATVYDSNDIKVGTVVRLGCYDGSDILDGVRIVATLNSINYLFCLRTYAFGLNSDLLFETDDCSGDLYRDKEDWISNVGMPTFMTPGYLGVNENDEVTLYEIDLNYGMQQIEVRSIRTSTGLCLQNTFNREVNRLNEVLNLSQMFTPPFRVE